MAFKHAYTLICDEVRQEINNKLLVIGLYQEQDDRSADPVRATVTNVLFGF